MADVKYWEKIPARPTTYKGIEMRSRLEARFAEQLDAWGVQWAYEPRCYADETGQYLPDFETWGWRLPLTPRRGGLPAVPGGKLRGSVFFEVKPPLLPHSEAEWIAREAAIHEQMRIIRSTHPRAGLCFWFDDSWFLGSFVDGYSDNIFAGPLNVWRCPGCVEPFLGNYQSNLQGQCAVHGRSLEWP